MNWDWRCGGFSTVNVSSHSKVTKRGKVVWTIRAEKKPAAKDSKWTPPVPDRARRIVGDKLVGLDGREFIG